jgi:predicted ATPase
MAELAHFKNFAKLKDTSIEFNDITVLAGKPGTGKSYVMKMMYAIEEMLVKSDDDIDIKNFYLHNLILSIFSKHEQISNKYSIEFDNLNMVYDYSTLTVNFKSFKSFKEKVNILFVETPLILEFKKFMNHEKGKTPYHIESLLNILDTDYSFIDKEQEKFIKSFREKSQAIIGGDIESSGDSFIFNRKDDKNYDILNASSGIKSIGLLQYLVTNKALKKGSVFFWEEPEVHLHPDWQKKMVELFIELMNAGIKIVFSTHSAYMIEYLNALSKKQELTNRVSFNLLQEENGIVENTILSDSDNWELIQDELLNPLEEIAWEYL